MVFLEINSIEPTFNHMKYNLTKKPRATKNSGMSIAISVDLAQIAKNENFWCLFFLRRFFLFGHFQHIYLCHIGSWKYPWKCQADGKKKPYIAKSVYVCASLIHICIKTGFSPCLLAFQITDCNLFSWKSFYFIFFWFALRFRRMQTQFTWVNHEQKIPYFHGTW